MDFSDFSVDQFPMDTLGFHNENAFHGDGGFRDFHIRHPLRGMLNQRDVGIESHGTEANPVGSEAFAKLKGQGAPDKPCGGLCRC